MDTGYDPYNTAPVAVPPKEQDVIPFFDPWANERVAREERPSQRDSDNQTGE